MKVMIAHRQIEWPAGWPLPAAGQRVVIDEKTWVVGGVEFHPPVVIAHQATNSAYLSEPVIVIEVVPPIGPVKEMQAQVAELEGVDATRAKGPGWGNWGKAAAE